MIAINKTKIHIFLISIIIVFYACEKDYDLKLESYKNKLVVNSLITEGEKISAEISFSKSFISADTISILKDATVLLYTNNSSMADTMKYSSFDAKHISNTIAIGNTTYKIVVHHPLFNSVYAITNTVSSVPIQSLSFVDSTGLDSVGLPVGTLSFNFNDDAAYKNNYILKVFYYNNNLAEWFALGIKSDDALIKDAIEKYGQDDGVFFNDLSFNGKNRSIELIIPFATATGSPKFYVELQSVSEEYNKYFKTLQLNQSSTFSFSEPARVYNNINNGLGIFAGLAIERDTIY